MNDEQLRIASMVDGLSWSARMRLVWRLLRDDRVSPWLKRLGPIGAILYLLSPIDIVPDFFIGVGQVDDLGVIAVVLLVLAKLLVRFAPPAVVAEHLHTMRHGDDRFEPDDGPVMDVPFRERRGGSSR